MNQPRHTAFQEAVWKAACKTPKGKVSTYGRIAEKVGRPAAARAVGNALNKNPYLVKVPCHRVIRGDGFVGGYGGPGETKRKIELLESEGVEIIGGYVDLRKFGAK